MRPWNGTGDLKVITAGEMPPNVTEAVGSKKIAAILSELTEDHELVIVDAPPLILADSYNIASRVDGVIVVMEPGQTSEEQARAMKEQLTRANARVMGIVFNKVSEERANSFYDYQYQSLYSAKYYGDYISKSPKELVPESPSKKLMDFFEYGKVPPDLATDVENALSTIKTQPRHILGRLAKSKKNGKP
jgi:Mrp family chromosome partitioning ATPase